MLSTRGRADARVTFTRSALVTSLLELLRTRNLDEISISELCKVAGVSRPTFYQHFRSLDDVLAAALDDRLEAIRLAATTTRPDESSTPTVVARFLDELWRDRRLYRVALRARSSFGLSRNVMETWLLDGVGDYFRERADDELPADFDQRVLFAAGGIIAVIARGIATRGLTHSQFTALGASLWDSVERAVVE